MKPRSTVSRSLDGRLLWMGLASMLLHLTGCAAFHPVEGIPARFVPEGIRSPSRANKKTIDLSLLSRTQPVEYQLDTGDVLAVYVEGVLPRPNELPPVHMPQLGEEAAPALGYPIPVRHDGTISLPLLTQPLMMRGLTVKHAEEAIRAAYTTGRKILQSGNERVWVILHKPRQTRVLVIRQEGVEATTTGGQPGTVNLGALKRGTGKVVTLAGYKNDVLHAIAETGGLPGLDAENMIYIIRAKRQVPTKPADMPAAPKAQVPTAIPTSAPTIPGPTLNPPGGWDLGPLPAPVPVDPARGSSVLSAPNPGVGVPPAPVSGFRPAGGWSQPPVRPVSSSQAGLRNLSARPVIRGQSPPPFGSYRNNIGSTNNSSVRQADFGLPAGAPTNRVWPVTESAVNPAANTNISTNLPGQVVYPMPDPLNWPQQVHWPAPNVPPGWPPGSHPSAMPNHLAPALPATGVGTPAAGFGSAAGLENAAGSESTVQPLDGRNLPDVSADAWMREYSSFDVTIGNPAIVKIPVRLSEDEEIHFGEDEVTLQEGDIVFIESRDTEIFYTGGLLGGGQFTLPRDYDLDVLGAIAIAQAGRQQVGGGGIQSNGGVTALNSDVTISGSEVIIIRKMSNGTQVPIKVDLYRAVRNPQDRILIQPGDYILLQYTPLEAVGAFFERHLLEGALFGLATSQLTNGN